MVASGPSDWVQDSESAAENAADSDAFRARTYITDDSETVILSDGPPLLSYGLSHCHKGPG